jgi:cell division protein DivIC
MKYLTLSFSLLKNKYVLATLFFAVFILFFDRNDYFTQKERKEELKKLEESKKHYVQQNEQLKKEFTDLKTNAAAIEKHAREKYYMKKDNEDVYLVIDSSKSKK